MRFDHRARPLAAVAVAFLVALAAACGEGASPAAVVRPAGSAAPGAPAPLYFVPPGPAATPRDGKLWVPFRRGEAFPGAPVTALAVRFDYLSFRLGGEQWVVAPEPGPGGLGVRLDVGRRRGGSLLGFTTEPRLVRWTVASGGTREVLVYDHVKVCIHVREGTFEPPRPSPAVAARFGFPLEIVPIADPLPVLPGSELPFRLRFDGPGIAGVEVVAVEIPQGGDGRPREVFRGKTGAGGHFVLPVARAGLWRVTAVHEVAATAARPAELHRAVLVFRTGER